MCEVLNLRNACVTSLLALMAEPCCLHDHSAVMQIVAVLEYSSLLQYGYDLGLCLRHTPHPFAELPFSGFKMDLDHMIEGRTRRELFVELKSAQDSAQAGAALVRCSGGS